MHASAPFLPVTTGCSRHTWAAIIHNCDTRTGLSVLDADQHAIARAACEEETACTADLIGLPTG
jgi:hypothetical protein